MVFIWNQHVIDAAHKTYSGKGVIIIYRKGGGAKI